jgi:antitoxin (DNA-binding transcriptional repressor) of toxin-antitoxin stability system
MKRQPVENRISKSMFKARAFDCFRIVEETGKPIVITHRRKPVLKIVRYFQDPTEALKALRGSVLRYDRPLDPVAIEDWEAVSRSGK